MKRMKPSKQRSRTEGGATEFFSQIGNAEATRRFIHDIGPAMSVDEGDYLTLATITSGKNRKETSIARLDRGDERVIARFLYREVINRGHGRYKLRYSGANGRPNRTKTFSYPADLGKRHVAPAPPIVSRPPSSFPPARSIRPSPSPTVPPKQSAKALEARLQKMTRALADLDGENGSLHDLLDQERRSSADIRQGAEEMQGRLAELEIALQRSDSELTVVKKKRLQTQAAMDQIQLAGKQGAAEERKLQSRIIRLTEDNERLSHSLARQRARTEKSRAAAAGAVPASKVDALRRELNKVTTERDQARQAIAQCKQTSTSQIATYKEELTMVENARLKLRDRFLRLEQENEKLQREVRRLRAENEDLAQHNSRLAAKQSDEGDEDDENYFQLGDYLTEHDDDDDEYSY